MASARPSVAEGREEYGRWGDEDAHDDSEERREQRQHDLPEVQGSRGPSRPATGSPGAVERAQVRTLLGAWLARATADGRPGEAERLVRQRSSVLSRVGRTTRVRERANADDGRCITAVSPRPPWGETASLRIGTAAPPGPLLEVRWGAVLSDPVSPRSGTSVRPRGLERAASSGTIDRGRVCPGQRSTAICPGTPGGP